MNQSASTAAQRVQMGLRKLPEDKAAEVLDFVEFLVLRYASPEDPFRSPGSSRTLTADPKDVLMDDGDRLHALYAEFAEEDRELAQVGLAHYTQTLQREETLP